MTALTARITLPVVTAVAAVFFLATAMAHVVVVPVQPQATVPPATFSVLKAEIHACEAASGRSHDECLDEFEGKALIQHAEQLAQLAEQQGVAPGDSSSDEGDSDAAVHPPRSSAR